MDVLLAVTKIHVWFWVVVIRTNFILKMSIPLEYVEFSKKYELTRSEEKLFALNMTSSHQN